MPALAKVVEGLTREMSLLYSEGFNDDVGSAKEHLPLTIGVGRGLTYKHYGELQVSPGTYPATVGVMDKTSIVGGFRFPEQNGDNCRSIQDHLGRPCSS